MELQQEKDFMGEEREWIMAFIRYGLEGKGLAGGINNVRDGEFSNLALTKLLLYTENKVIETYI